MSYYKTIDGVRYDRRLLEAAEAFTRGRGESRISVEEMQKLHQIAVDGGRFTDTEKQTLQYIAQTYALTDAAKKWFAEQNNQGGLEETIRSIVRDAYGLPHLRWQIDPLDVAAQQKGAVRNFADALRGALDAFLHGNQGQLSFSVLVARRDLAYQDSPDKEAMLRTYLDKGTLLLIPKLKKVRTAFAFDTPEDLDQDNFWVFGLQLPDFFPVQFIAYVLRFQLGQHSEGYFSRKVEPDLLIPRVVLQYAQYSRLKWSIAPAEVQRQLDKSPGQNFGNALFYALHEGIYNAESSFSFRDFITQEIWADPERNIQDYQREYVESGTLHLLSKADDPAFPVPDMFWPDIEEVWIFGLEMPLYTHARFVITVNRKVSYFAFNDGFLAENLSFEARLQQIASQEFKVEGLQCNFQEAEYVQQRQQFGPEWRHSPGLLRQALNTVLYDYLRPGSVFNIAREVLQAEVNPEHYDTVAEYRASISYRIREFLKTATLEFLPVEGSENIPADGERVQENWLFFLHMPALSDHGFFIVIQRRPDDGQLPYNYGVN